MTAALEAASMAVAPTTLPPRSEPAVNRSRPGASYRRPVDPPTAYCSRNGSTPRGR